MSFTPAKDRNRQAATWRTMNYGWFGLIGEATQFAQPPTLIPGEYITQINPANSGVVNILGSDANGFTVTPLETSIALTSAQLLALFSAPVTLIPAPGAGKAIYVEYMVFEMNRTATAYTGANTTSLVYHGSTTAITLPLLGTVFTTAAAAQTVTVVSGLGGATNGTPLTANTAVDLATATANYAAGTGTAKVFLKYSIVTL